MIFYLGTLMCILLLLTHEALSQIPAPLEEYHPGCNSVQLSRDPACMAAYHRYCLDNKYGSAGYSQEVGLEEIGFLCVQSLWYGNIAYGDVTNCNGATQSIGCYSSAHRFCIEIDKTGVGMVQEVGPSGVGLACASYSWYGVLDISLLRGQHPGCTSTSQAQDPPCLAAIHRYCTVHNLGLGGAITEVRPYEVEAACISQGSYHIARVTGV